MKRNMFQPVLLKLHYPIVTPPSPKDIFSAKARLHYRLLPSSSAVVRTSTIISARLSRAKPFHTKRLDFFAMRLA